MMNIFNQCRHYSTISTSKVLQTSSRSLYSWGTSWCGQLGLGKNISEQYTPKKVQDIEFGNSGSLLISSGSYHTLLYVEQHNKLYGWGESLSGQLGVSKDNVSKQQQDKYYQPTLIDFFQTKKRIVSLGCGGFHSLICVEEMNGDYNTYSFGRNIESQLGLETTTTADNTPFIYKPSLIKQLSGKQIQHISCGPNYSIVITNQNEIYSFGINDMGQCGHNNQYIVKLPKQIEEFKDLLMDGGVKKITSGWGHTLISTGDRLLVFGSNIHGQCGLGFKSKEIVKPQVLPLPTIQTIIKDITTGSCASLAIIQNDTKTETLIWGSCGDGKLGGGQTADQIVPTPMQLPDGVEFSKASFGTDHCIALDTKNNQLWGWGFGQHGTFGLGKDNLVVFKYPQLLDHQSYKLNNNNEIQHIECSIDTSYIIVNHYNK